MSSYVIVGAGECGARAAFALREKGFDGSITLVGSEPHLPYERPPLSKDAIIAGSAPKLVADAEGFAAAGIEVLLDTQVVAIDRARKELLLLDADGPLPYDKLLLTTGARPRELPVARLSNGRVRSLRSHGDAMAIRRHLASACHLTIIGGGFIGLELAAAARGLGAEVTLLEGLPRVLSRGVPAEIAEVVASRHRQEGVELICDAKIDSIEELPDRVDIRLADGRAISSDLLVVGAGSIPNTDIAEAAGLAIANGISVDQHLRTSDPDIFAAGDCCSFPLGLYDGRRIRLESWRNALEQGQFAAANMLGLTESTSAVPWFWSDQYDLTLQIAGLAEGSVLQVRRNLADDAFILFDLDAGGRLIAASGIGKGNAVARDIRVAEMMIAARILSDPTALAAPDVKLKSLLAA
ncbi:FAD-dependent oxidoreductase [Sinorhizobium sp. BG8]|uniref:NAD(P)/FAD-dependent oxidoreductase n=1 Tax=Sinorhizobium sp. BG8 TaxID=2613773 RepID=UPI00193E1F0D|nr:FAD-dependent oxidoreductase [Sinorhizobium sp. BG8]QRM55861.1 ferredoxin reductase [Sinorhizobium sp. BG8]